MSIVDETTCLKKLPEEKLGQLEFVANWVVAREWSRVHQSDKLLNALPIGEVDSMFAKAWQDFKQGKETDLRSQTPEAQVAFIDAFLGTLSSFTSADGKLVGWDNDACVMNWYSYACLCSYFARMTLPDALAALQEFQTTKKRPSWVCSMTIGEDATYDCDWPMPKQSCQDPWTWKDWIVPAGIAVVGAGLLWWMFKGSGARANPAPGALKWSTVAGGTSAKEGKHGYVAVGDFGEYHINPPPIRGWGYTVMWANTKGMNAPHGGLWHNLGKFPSPAGAQKAAREHAESLTPMRFALENPARKSSHFVVKMSNSEDDSVLLIVEGPGAAKWAKEYKQSAAGSYWEADGPDFAYTIVSDYPGLVKDLKQERYNLDQSEYSPPEES